MAKSIQVNKVDVVLGLKLLKELVKFRPYSSISFQSNGEILSAAEETERISSFGMAKNKHKMKDTANQVMQIITETEPEEPVNLNLSDYELKSLTELKDLLERVLNGRKDDVILI